MKVLQKNTHAIENLLQHRLLWRASDALQTAEDVAVISTGYQLFDHQLHCGGWPLAQLIECLPQNLIRLGMGVFLPALKKLQAIFGEHWPVILIDPPCTPYLAGWPLSQSTNIWLLNPRTIQEKIWLAETALANNCSLAIFIWLDEKNIPAAQIRKLQLAATKHNGLSIIFRQPHAASQRSAASLRFEINTSQAKNLSVKKNSYQNNNKTNLEINILKQPNSWGGQRFCLPWHSRLQRPYTPAKNWPVYNPEESSYTFELDEKMLDNSTAPPRYS